MAADTTPAERADDCIDPLERGGQTRSIRPVLIAAVLALAATWALGSTAFGSELQHVVQHIFPGDLQGCGEPGG